MKIPLRQLCLLALPLCQAHAALQPSLIGADSQWVVYADLNGLRASSFGKQLVDFAAKAPQFKIPNSDLHLDLPKILATVGSITAYGSNLTNDPKLVDGTLIFQGTPDLRKIAEAALVQATITTPESVSEEKDLPFSAYGVGKQVFVGFPSEPIIVVSKSKVQLVKALAVFRGKSASLASASASPIGALLENSKGSILFAASVVPSSTVFPRGGPQARILQLAKAGSVAIGEEGTQTFAHVDLVAESDEMAEKLNKILEGLTAVLSLGQSNDQALADFLNSAKVERNHDAVTLSLDYSSARLAEMIKNLQEPKRSSAGARAELGKLAAEWKGEAAEEGPIPGPKPPVWKTVDNVHLTNNSTLILRVRGNLSARKTFDRVEISPMDGSGSALVFRSNFMRFSPGRPGGGKGKSAETAQFQFPGEDGNYRIKVRYSDGSDGEASFSLSVRDPESAPEGASANDDLRRIDSR